MPIKHAKVSALADSGDSSLVQPSDWNDAHDLSAFVAADITDFDAAVAAAAVPSDFQPSIVTGNYYLPPMVLVGGNPNPTADKLTAVPIWFSSTETWTRIGFSVTFGGAGADKMRLGLYNSNASNLPGSLLVDSGELACDTIADVEATISQSLAANTLYWLASLTNNAGTTEVTGMSASGTPSLNWLTGAPSVADLSNVSNVGSYVYKDTAYGALPASFGTPTGYGLSNGMPLIWLRKV